MVPEQVPAPLRRLASFAPSRRARLGGDRILETAEADEVFRGRLAVQARAVVPEAGVELDAGDAASIDAAALAWLERPDGWQDVVTRAAESRTRPRGGGRSAGRGRARRPASAPSRRRDGRAEGGTAEGTRRPRLAPCRQRRPTPQAGGVPAPGEGRGRGCRRSAPHGGGGGGVRAHGAGRGRGQRSGASAHGSPSWNSDSWAPSASVGRTATMPASGRGCCWTPCRRGDRAQARARPADRGRRAGRPGRRRRGRRRAPGVVGGVFAAGRRPCAARPAACAAAGAHAGRRLQRDQDRLARGRPRRAA